MIDQNERSGLPLCATCNKPVESVDVDNNLREKKRGMGQPVEYESAGQTWTARCHGATETQLFYANDIARTPLKHPPVFFKPDSSEDPDRSLPRPNDDYPTKHEAIERETVHTAKETGLADLLRLDAAQLADLRAKSHIKSGRPLVGLDELPVFKPTTRVIGREVSTVAQTNICTPHVATLPDGSTVTLPAGTVLREWTAGAEIKPDTDDLLADAGASVQVGMRATGAVGEATRLENGRWRVRTIGGEATHTEAELRELAVIDPYGESATDVAAAAEVPVERALLQRARQWIRGPIAAPQYSAQAPLLSEIDAFLAGLPVTSNSAPIAPGDALLAAAERYLRDAFGRGVRGRHAARAIGAVIETALDRILPPQPDAKTPR